MSRLEERIRSTPVSNQSIRDAVTRAIINKGALEWGMFYSIFGNALTKNEVMAVYLSACYSKEEFERAGRKRDCGNPAFVHSYGVAQTLNDFLTLELATESRGALNYLFRRNTLIRHPNRLVCIIAALFHDGGEDLGISKETLTQKLGEIAKETGAEIDIGGVVNIVYGVTKSRPKGMRRTYYYEQVYLGGIVKEAENDHESGNPYYDGKIIVKLADRGDNTITAWHLNATYKTIYSTFWKSLVNAGAAERIIERTGFNSFIFALQQYLVNVTVEEIDRTVEDIEALKERRVNGARPNLRIDYGMTETEVKRRIEQLQTLKSEILEFQKRPDLTLECRTRRPIGDYFSALSQQIPWQLPFHLPTDISSAA